MDKLDQPDQFTLFAPTNEAFDKLTPGFMESIFENEPVIKGNKNQIAYCLIMISADFKILTLSTLQLLI